MCRKKGDLAVTRDRAVGDGVGFRHAYGRSQLETEKWASNRGAQIKTP